MLWVAYALLTAFSLSTADVLSKKALKDTDPFTIMWVREGYALPFLALAVFFVPFPALDTTFWLALSALVPLEILALFLYMRAIRTSPLSLTIPFLALSPVFIMAVAFFLLGERPSRAGFTGVVLIAVGAYLLNAGAYREGVLGPLKAIGRERGSVLMIAVALIYSVTSTLGKVAIEHSDPLFFGFFYPFVLTIVMTPFLATGRRAMEAASRPWLFLAIGFFTAIMVLSHYTALSMTQVAYMISVKRMSILFSVIYGWAVFREGRMGERLTGSLFMVAGVALIALF